MAGQFISPDGDLEVILPRDYITDYAVIDQYAKTGSLWLWGNNNYGSLGDNTATSKSSPVQTVAGGTIWKQVASGGFHAAAVKVDGTLWLWGRNNYGQLGDNTAVNKSSPVQTVAGGTNWKQVSCGYYHTAAVKTDGSLWAWGQNGNGRVGDNTLVTKSSPVQTVAAGNTWKLVACGGYHTAAIKTDGTLWTWGNNTLGMLGTNNTTGQSSPVQTVSAGTNWKLVAGGKYYTAAIKTDGTLWLWGRNNYGVLGDNTMAGKSSPVQTVAAGTNWKSVACGVNHTAGIKTDGTLWLWGRNNYGQLADNTVASKSSPVQTVAAGTNWKQVVTASEYTSSIKTDGTLWTWGASFYGNLGDATTVRKSSPIQTIAGGTNWKQVSAGLVSITSAIYFYDSDRMYPAS